MSRPLRIEYPGAWYHVMNRGRNRGLIYSCREDYLLFLETIGEACRLYNVSLSSYCLMSNHYHLLVQTPEGNLSRFMRHLNGVYTQRYNRKHKKDSSLFRGRYKGILIQEDPYLLQVMKYIHFNPMKAKIAAKVEDYEWCSHRYFLGNKGRPGWLDTDYVLAFFSKRRRAAVESYKAFMALEMDHELRRFYSRRNQGSIFGDASFLEKIKEDYIYGDPSLENENREKRKIRGEGKICLINYEVCKSFGINKEGLFETRRGKKNVPRLMALSLARELTGLSLRELAWEYQAKNYRTVATSCYRFRQDLKNDKKIARRYAILRGRCSQEKT